MSILDKIKLGSTKVKTPWYKMYNNIPKHINYPKGSLYDIIKNTADKYPEYTAYSYYKKNKSYASFIKEIENCAKAFKSIGVSKGDIVTICMPNTPEAIISFYALNKIGAICNMIHPLSSEKEIEFYINNAKSNIIIAVDLVLNKINSIINKTNLITIILVSVSTSMDVKMKIAYYLTKGIKVKKTKCNFSYLTWNEFLNKSRLYKGKTKTPISAYDPAVILYSGGTTGNPKGIILSNMNFNSLVFQDLAVCKRLLPGTSILSVMPIFHGFGLGCTIHAAYAVGARTILLPSFKAKTFDTLLLKYHPNVIAGVPTIFEGLYNSPKLKNKDLSFLTCCICGGDTMSQTLKEQIDQFLKDHNAKTKVRPAYGLTECTAGVCMTPVDSERRGSVGIPCPDTYIKIVAPNTHTELPYMGEGEICVSGPTVMMGYLNEPKETALALRKHDDGRIWLHTGDLGYMDEDGFVYFKQRLKRMIVSSGYNIYPSHIENIINTHPDVLTSTVIGIDHPYKVQVAKAYIILKKGIEPSISVKRSIKEHCEKNIASYSLPYEYEFRKTLPTTLVGKVAYRKLLEEEQEKNNSKNNEV